VRLTFELKLITTTQHHAFIEQIDNIGKQLGGWLSSGFAPTRIKTTRSTETATAAFVSADQPPKVQADAVPPFSRRRFGERPYFLRLRAL